MHKSCYRYHYNYPLFLVNADVPKLGSFRKLIEVLEKTSHIYDEEICKLIFNYFCVIIMLFSVGRPQSSSQKSHRTKHEHG